MHRDPFTKRAPELRSVRGFLFDGWASPEFYGASLPRIFPLNCRRLPGGPGERSEPARRRSRAALGWQPQEVQASLGQPPRFPDRPERGDLGGLPPREEYGGL